MEQFELRQSSLRQDSIPALLRNEHLMPFHILELRIASALRIAFEVERAHMLHRNCDMQIDLPRGDRREAFGEVCLIEK